MKVILIFLIMLLLPSMVLAVDDREGLQLEPLIEEALKTNPELAALRNRLRAVEARINQERSLDDPEIGIMEWGISSDFRRVDQTWYLLDQKIPYPGKLKLKGDIAAKEAEMVEEEYRAKELEIVRMVKHGYYDLFLINKAIDINRAHKELVHEFSRIAETRYALGMASQQDVIKAQLELTRLTNELLTLVQEKETMAASINTLLNRSTDSPLGRPILPEVKPFSKREEDLRQLAVEMRPQVRMEMFAIERGEASKALAKRGLYPDFMFELGYWDVHGGPNQWQTQVMINIPWIFRGKYDSKIMEASSEIERSKAGLISMKNNTFLEIKEEFTRLRAAERSAELYRTTLLPIARQSLDSSIIGYKAGKLDFLSLFESGHTLKELEMEYFRVSVEFYKRLSELERIVGSILENGE